MTRPVVWSVSVSDSSGSAGLQADQRALDALRVHICTVAAAVTTSGLRSGVRPRAVAPDLIEAQLTGLSQDLTPSAIKAGQLGSAENARLLARWVRRLREAGPVALVVDPVGPEGVVASPADTALRRVLREELLPLATVCTPSRRDVAWLLGDQALRSDEELLAAIPALESLGPCSWLVTDSGSARDLLVSPQFSGWLSAPLLDLPDRLGCSCTLSAALAGALAQGFCEADACVLAKAAVTQALQLGEPAGTGPGPVRAEPGFARRLDNLPKAWPLSGPTTGPAFAPEEEPGLCAVVDSAAWLSRLARAGVRQFQLLLPRRLDGALVDEARLALSEARRLGARLYLNLHWWLALDLGADGVHLDPDDLDTEIDRAALHAAGLGLGIGARSLWELARAMALQPSYLGFGPVHAGRTLLAPWRAQGTHNLGFVCGLVQPLPVLAVGGLTPDRVRNAARCGIAGFAVGPGLTSSFDPEAEVVAYQRAWSEGRRLMPQTTAELPLSVLGWQR